jgi:hypothetical protein
MHVYRTDTYLYARTGAARPCKILSSAYSEHQLVDMVQAYHHIGDVLGFAARVSVDVVVFSHLAGIRIAPFV